MVKKNIQPKKQLKMEAKRYLIISDIANGLSYMDLVKKYSKEWGLKETSVMCYINDTISFMQSEKTKSSLLSMNMERLDKLITDSMKDGDRKNAIKAIDTQNKLAGGYTEKISLEGDTEVNLVFDL